MTKGFCTVACNTNDINYLEHAYHLAVSIKDTQSVKEMSVVVNTATQQQFEEKHRQIFDHVITVPADIAEKKDFISEIAVWQSPYKQTIKVEADMIMTANLDHWWPILDQKDVVLTSQVETYWGETIQDRSQRQLFDINNLPDVYSGLYYFRRTLDAKKFFVIVAEIFHNWPWFRDHYLKNCRYEHPVTDEVFAIAAKIFGVEKCTLLGPVPSFVHMKNELQKIASAGPWFEAVQYEKNEYVNIGFFRQHLPLHYHNKKFIEVLND